MCKNYDDGCDCVDCLTVFNSHLAARMDEEAVKLQAEWLRSMTSLTDDQARRESLLSKADNLEAAARKVRAKAV
jgi:hypothetical protein